MLHFYAFTGDFSKAEDCDRCLEGYLIARHDALKDGMAQTDTYQDKSFELRDQIDFSNGCPWAKACQSATLEAIRSATSEADAANFATVIEKCQGEGEGRDYEKAGAAKDELMETVRSLMGSQMAPPERSEEASPSSGAETRSLSMLGFFMFGMRMAAFLQFVPQ